VNLAALITRPSALAGEAREAPLGAARVGALGRLSGLGQSMSNLTAGAPAFRSGECRKVASARAAAGASLASPRSRGEGK
jgi:hypothetical protein